MIQTFIKQKKKNLKENDKTINPFVVMGSSFGMKPKTKLFCKFH